MEGSIGSCLSRELNKSENKNSLKSFQVEHNHHEDDIKHFEVGIKEKYCGKCFRCEAYQFDDKGQFMSSRERVESMHGEFITSLA